VSRGSGAETALLGSVKRVQVGLQRGKKYSVVQTVSSYVSQATYYVLLENHSGVSQA